MFIPKTSLSLLLFFVFIIYFTIRKVNPLCEKIIYTRKKVGNRPTSNIKQKNTGNMCVFSCITRHAWRVRHHSGRTPHLGAPTNPESNGPRITKKH